MNTVDSLNVFQQTTLKNYRKKFKKEINKTNEELKQWIEDAAFHHKYHTNSIKTKYERLKKELKQIKKRLEQTYEDLWMQSEVLLIDLMSRGLSPARIKQFQHFKADESLVGEKCSICLANFKAGRRLIRLDCEGRHVFHQVCIEGWFAGKTTCPNCRHAFF